MHVPLAHTDGQPSACECSRITNHDVFTQSTDVAGIEDCITKRFPASRHLESAVRQGCDIQPPADCTVLSDSGVAQ